MNNALIGFSVGLIGIVIITLSTYFGLGVPAGTAVVFAWICGVLMGRVRKEDIIDREKKVTT